MAPITWQETNDDDGGLLAFTSGPAESASHVETSLMQIVQECIIEAQCERLHQNAGVVIDRTERLANALTHLCLVTQRLNSLPKSYEIALFAGRRSSDRVYLLLQNLFLAKHLKVGQLEVSNKFSWLR